MRTNIWVALEFIGKVAHALLDTTLVATLVWLMCNYKDILELVWSR